MTVDDAIQCAEQLLPGTPGGEAMADPRWQSIIAVGEFTESNPEQVWRFANRWGRSDDEDLRQAIATCLVEHLLEYHFELIFPLVEKAVQESALFARTFSACWKFGESLTPANARRFDRLLEEARRAS